jgi:hypothetical protein
MILRTPKERPRRDWPAFVLLTLLIWPPSAALASEPPGNSMMKAYGWVSGNDTLFEMLFGPNDLLDRAGDDWTKFKKDHSIPITISAYNWLHINNNGPLATDYGIPSLPGTYFYWLDFDPQMSLGDQNFQHVGAHVEFRWRDSPVRWRRFFANNWWFYEAYGYVDTPIGRFKVGQIWRRVGLDWDDSWWGNVLYFDGFKLDTDYGVSWENTWKLAPRYTMDSFIQYFPIDSRQDASLAGADPKSVRGASEQNYGVIRLVPTLHISESSWLALGLSALAGEILYTPALGGDRVESDWAVDLDYHNGGLRLFGEFLQSYGRRNPHNYISGGPSNKLNDVIVGTNYKVGPLELRFAWSAGFLGDPTGRQFLYVPGLTLAVIKNLDLIFEYVRWEVWARKARTSTKFEDGFQAVLNWRI